MPISNNPIRQSTKRTSHETPKSIGTGTYMAKVVGHMDKKFMGGLKVQLLRQGSSPDSDSRNAQTKIVQYASPFYGVTPNYSASDEDSYRATQQSYGFWAVPPDIGSIVLCTFVEGLDDHGFWFACVPANFMNFMVPDGRAATANTTANIPEVYKNKKVPVGEYNVNKVDPQGQTQPTYYPRPANPDAIISLEGQGLLHDDIRGVTSTSARREIPSMVFGMSTPGPLDKRPNAPKVPRGTIEDQVDVFSSRLGGQSIVMDDGDEKIVRRGHPGSTPAEYANIEQSETGGDQTRPANELMRFRTRTGHQILLHNTEDLVYIANSRGTAWIELTSNGKIDIFAQDSVSIHSQQDLNFAADRDINFTAYEGDVNVVAGGKFQADLGNGINFTSGASFRLNAAEDLSLNAANVSVSGIDNVSILSQASMSMLGKSQVTVGSEGADTTIESGTAVKIFTDGDIHALAKGSTFITSFEGETHLSSALKTSITAENLVDISSTAANVRITANNEIHLKSGNSMYQQSGARIDINAAQSGYFTSGSNINLKAAGVVAADAGEVHLNSGLAGSAGSATPANTSRLATQPTAPSPIVPIEPTHAAQVSRVPQHEPWMQHENLNPVAYSPERTRAGLEQVDSTPIPRTNGGTGVLPDTFLPPNKQSASGTINTQYSPQFDNTQSPGTVPPVYTPNATTGTISDPLTEAPAGAISGFTDAQTTSYLNTLGQRESGNRYDAVNSIGFAGKYQFGKLALADMGYIRMDKVRTGTNLQVMTNPASWSGKDGISSIDDWTSAPELQESVMLRYTNGNLRTLNRIGAVTSGDSKETIMGMLMGAHLLGPKGIKDWRNGQGGADAYGTSGGEYFQLGKSAFNGAAPNIENPNRLEQDEELQKLYAQRQEQSGGPV